MKRNTRLSFDLTIASQLICKETWIISMNDPNILRSFPRNNLTLINNKEE